jgi:hypothetical protein
MKKMIIFLLLIALFAPSFAQDAPAVAVEKNVLKVNTLALVIGSGSVFYERKFTDLTAGQLGVAYLNYKIGDTRFSGLILTPEVKLYVRKNAIDGFYISPYLRYNNYKYEVKDSDSKGTLNSYGGGVAFGRQWIFKKGFVMDLFFGGHYLSADVNVTSGTETADITKVEGFRTRIGFNLGFAF